MNETFPGRYSLNVYRGDSYIWRVVIWHDTHRTQPMDLTGFTARAEIDVAQEGSILITVMTCRITLPNIVDVYLSAQASNQLPQLSAWDLQLTNPNGLVKTILRGDVRSIDDVTDTVSAAVPTPHRGLMVIPKRGRAA